MKEKTSEPNVLAAFGPHRYFSISECMALSLISSDNRCANALLQLVGLTDFREYMALNFGIDIQKFSDFSDESLRERVAEMRATATDVVKILQHLDSRPAYAQIKYYTHNCLNRSRIVSEIEVSNTSSVRNKTGTLTPIGVFSDAASIEKFGNKIQIVHMTERCPSIHHANQVSALLGQFALEICHDR